MTTAAPREPLLTGPFFQLWTFSFFTFLSAFQLFPTVPFRILYLGGSKAEAGLFLGFYTYAAALSAPLTGSIADQVGRRRLLVIVSALFVVFSLLYGVITSRPLLLAAGLVHGVLWSSMLTSSGAIMTAIIPMSRRTEGLAYWGIASTIAIAIAPVIGLQLQRRGWGAVCIAMALLSVVMCVIAARLPRDEVKADARFPLVGEIYDPRVIVTALTLSAVSFGYGGVTSYVALFSVDKGIDPPSLYFTVFALVILVARLILGPYADRIEPRLLLYPSLAACSASLVILAYCETRAELAASATLFGAGMGLAFPTFISFVIGRTDPAHRAAIFGNVIMAFDAGIGTGSTVVGVLIERDGYRAAFLVAAGIALLSCAIFAATSRLWRQHPVR